MPIIANCSCGRTIRASEKLAGKWVKCPACAQPVQIPGPPELLEDINIGIALDAEPERGPAAPIPQPAFQLPDTSAYQAPRAVIPAADEDIAAAEKSWRGYLFWLLLLAMIPLAAEVFGGHEDVEARLDRTLDAHPDVEKRIGSRDEVKTRRDADRVLDLLPEHRLDGALVARKSMIHWPWALAATGLFFAIVTFALPGFPARPWQLALAGLFTGTGGVLLLMGIQIFGFVCFCCIGAAYLAALDPRAPFGASLLGFFFGVGFLEEMIKSLPVLFLLYRHDHVPWRTACLWGMASGAGFGISEGIHYCTNYYNGFEPASIYFVRFLSCVAFHTLLSGSCAILLQRKMHFLHEGEGPFDWVMTFMAIISAPILLHGLFDTLAKKDLNLCALGVAVLSFGWLWYLIRQSRMRENITETVRTTGPVLVRTAGGTRLVKRK